MTVQRWYSYDLWTVEQLRVVRDQYGIVPAAKIAATVGHREDRVRAAARILGVTRSQREPPAALIELIRRRNGEGCLDSEIAAEWPRDHDEYRVNRRIVAWIRKERLQLRANGGTWSPRQHAVHSRAMARWRAKKGYRSQGDIRARAYAGFAGSRGWPANLRPRHAQILDLLYERGPHTREEIAVAIGWNLSGGQKSYLSSVPGEGLPSRGSYMADLVYQGLVVKSAGRVGRTSSGSSCYVYSIAPGVVRGNVRGQGNGDV